MTIQQMFNEILSLKTQVAALQVKTADLEARLEAQESRRGPGRPPKTEEIKVAA